MRENAEGKFFTLFKSAEEKSNELGEEIKLPRIAQHQRNRDNYETNSPEAYYRLALFIPFVDHFIAHMNERFLKHKEILRKIQNVLPNKIQSINESELFDSIDSILLQWPEISMSSNDDVIKNESNLWQQKWKGADDKPETFIDAINFCNELIFPNIFKILKICATIPVTVATIERSFSTLKRIKTYLRNSTGENRLTGLASLSIHRDINVETEEVIGMFREKNRRLPL